jgi:hypothetical protein
VTRTTTIDSAFRRPLDIWPLVTRPGDAPLPAAPGALRCAASLLADLVSPALAEHLLAPAAARRGAALVDPAAVARDRLFKTFTLAQQRRWAKRLVEADIGVVFLKGFANAHTLYADPVVRAQGDLDILVHDADLARTIGFLASHGFRFRTGPVNPWGMISDASFMPMVSPDGACHIDIHIHPDCYPAHRSLTTELVFAGAATAEFGGVRFLTPCAEHALILCATNAAKDKYFLSSVTKVLDAVMLLRAHATTLDWGRIVGLARDGAFLRPALTFLALLAALGAPMDGVPRALRAPPRGLRGIAFRGVVDDYRALFPHDVPLTTYLWREWLIGADARVSFRNSMIRIKGLFRPPGGIPEGGPVESSDVLLPHRSNAGVQPGIRAMEPNMRSCIQE